MRNRLFIFVSALLLLALFLLAYPVYVIRPFRHQGPRELAAALWITRYRTVGEIILSLLAVAILMAVWRHAPTRRKITFAVLTALVVVFGILSHINIYEQMFHPLSQPAFSPASISRLNPGEQVIAVHIGTAARAYPIRVMSYHHIVNDTLDHRAIVATY